MEKEKQKLFAKKAKKIGKHFDTCICLARDNGDNDTATFQNGREDEMAHAIILLLRANEGLKMAVYRALATDVVKQFSEELNGGSLLMGDDDDA